MRRLSLQRQAQLQEMFGPGAAFDRLERMFYSHDVGSLPSLVQPLIGNALPAAVVQPLSEEQVVQLARWAQANKVLLVPRRRSTSGYGASCQPAGAWWSISPG